MGSVKPVGEDVPGRVFTPARLMVLFIRSAKATVHLKTWTDLPFTFVQQTQRNGQTKCWPNSVENRLSPSLPMFHLKIFNKKGNKQQVAVYMRSRLIIDFCDLFACQCLQQIMWPKVNNNSFKIPKNYVYGGERILFQFYVFYNYFCVPSSPKFISNRFNPNPFHVMGRAKCSKLLCPLLWWA